MEFPLLAGFRFIIPTIIAGNGVLLKHSPNVQGCASQIEKCFQKSGFPKNLVRNIRLKKNKVKKDNRTPFGKGRLFNW